MSPNCVHCKEMEPWYSELGLFFKEYKERIPLAHINCENYIDFCRAQGIPTFPDVRLYIREHPITYPDHHKSNDLKRWILGRLNHHPNHIKTVDYLKKLSTKKYKKKNRYSGKKSSKYIPLNGVFVFNGHPEKDEYHFFDIASKLDHSCEWGYTESPEVWQFLKSKKAKDTHPIGPNTKVVFWHPDTMEVESMPHQDPDLHFGWEDIDDWVHHMKHPTISYLGPVFVNDVLKGHFSGVILFASDESDPAVDQFEKAALQNKKNLKHFIITHNTDHTSRLYRMLNKKLHIENHERPFVMHLSHHMNFNFDKFLYTGKITEFNIVHWVQNVSEGRVDQYWLSSKPLTAEQQLKHVIPVISADEITKKVKKNYKKDTLILYHPKLAGRTDHSGESEKAMELIEDIQYEFADDKSIQFFTMDCDDNELGAMNLLNCWEGTHWVLWNRHKKTHEEYEGNAKPNKLIAWVKKFRGGSLDFSEMDL